MWSLKKSAENIWLQDEFSKRKALSSSSASSVEQASNNSMLELMAPSSLNFIATRIVNFVILIIILNTLTTNNGNCLVEAEPAKSVAQQTRQSTPISAIQRQPHFIEPESEQIQRVSVGRAAKFKCVIDDIGNHKVIWFHKEKRLPLVIDNKVNIWKDRLQASSQGNSVFFLQLDNVQVSDKGHFSCQLNTQPLMSQVHVLDVVKPPQIREEETTINVEPVKEFASLELKCVADGIPKPTIKWRRESQMHVLPPISSNDEWNNLDPELSEEVPEDSVPPTELAAAAANPSAARLMRHQDQERTGDISSNNLANRRQVAPRDVSNSIDAAAAAATTIEPPTDGDDGKVNTSADNPGQSGTESRSDMSQQQTLLPAATNSPEAPQSSQSSAHSNNNQSGSSMAEGEVLRFDRISRYDMGFYMCIASNGVPPGVSQRIFVPVSFVQTPKASSQRALTASARRSDTATSAGAANSINVDVNKQVVNDQVGKVRSRISPTARRGGLGGGGGSAAGRRRITSGNNSSSNGGAAATSSNAGPSNLHPPTAQLGRHYQQPMIYLLTAATATSCWLTAVVVVIVGGRWI